MNSASPKRIKKLPRITLFFGERVSDDFEKRGFAGFLEAFFLAMWEMRVWGKNTN